MRMPYRAPPKRRGCHLDGVGEIRQPDAMHWQDIDRRIPNADKRAMLLSDAKECMDVMDALGGREMYINIGASAKNPAAVKPLMDLIT